MTGIVVFHKVTTYCDTILEFIQNYDFTQTVDTPTRNNHILDVFLTNQPSLINSCQVIPGISDHEIVYTSAAVAVQYSKPAARKIFLWHKANFDVINEYIASFTNDFIRNYTHSTSIDFLWEEFKRLCDHCLHLIPQKMTCTRFGPPWLTRDIKRLSRKKQRRYNVARSKNLENDWANYNKLKKETQLACRKSYNNYVSSLYLT